MLIQSTLLVTHPAVDLTSQLQTWKQTAKAEAHPPNRWPTPSTSLCMLDPAPLPFHEVGIVLHTWGAQQGKSWVGDRLGCVGRRKSRETGCTAPGPGLCFQSTKYSSTQVRCLRRVGDGGKVIRRRREDSVRPGRYSTVRIHQYLKAAIATPWAGSAVSRPRNHGECESFRRALSRSSLTPRRLTSNQPEA